MTEIAGVDRPLTAEEKAARLAADIKSGLVLEKPSCECGWKGSKLAPAGAGCPKCGARLGLAIDPRPRRELEGMTKKLSIQAEQLAAAAKEIKSLKAQLEAQGGEKKTKKGAEE